MMPTLIMCKGLPAAGKTHWAKQQVLEAKGAVKRINKDDLRAMLDAGQWSKKSEKSVLRVRDMLVQGFLESGHSVIVDDCNLNPVHEETLRALAEKFHVNFAVKDFTDVSLQECLKRDSERANAVGEKVIKGMYNSFLRKKKDVAQYVPTPVNPDLPMCIIVDIDGTVAHMAGRSPYDYSMVHTDVPDDNVVEIVRRYARRDPNEFTPDTYIMIVSGRTDDCKDVTEKWLQDNKIPYDEIHMRKAGDTRNDAIVKEEIYNEWIKDRYNVRFVLDDRNRVVDKWRELGLKCLQVEPGDF